MERDVSGRPEPQTWAWGDDEPEPTPGWEFETHWEFGGGEYMRVYTRPVIKHTYAEETK